MAKGATLYCKSFPCIFYWKQETAKRILQILHTSRVCKRASVMPLPQPPSLSPSGHSLCECLACYPGSTPGSYVHMNSGYSIHLLGWSEGKRWTRTCISRTQISRTQICTLHKCNSHKGPWVRALRPCLSNLPILIWRASLLSDASLKRGFHRKPTGEQHSCFPVQVWLVTSVGPEQAGQCQVPLRVSVPWVIKTRNTPQSVLWRGLEYH